MTGLVRWTGTADEWKAGRAPPGSWFPHPLGPHSMLDERTFRGERVVVELSCPLCARVMTLGNVHSISPDGRLSPSLVCANKVCTWHVFTMLDGWALCP